MADDTGGPPIRSAPVTLSQALATDGVRRVVPTVAYLFCLVGALSCFGLIDNSPPSLAELLPPTASLLGAGAEADRLWWVVMVGLGMYAAWMWLPFGTRDPRGRAIAYPAAASMALLGVWFFVVRSGQLIPAAVAVLAVLAALIWTLRVAGRVPGRTFLGRQVSQLGIAVTLGWMAVVASETLGAVAVAQHPRADALSAETWGILAVTALLGLGMALLRYLPGRLYIASAMAWGFVWVAYARVTGSPKAYGLAVVSLVCAPLVLIAGVTVFLWARAKTGRRIA